MATSIDKSVNWRSAAAAPDYQVAARRVDTYVQPERNTKGQQIAEAIEQTASTASSIGKRQAQDKKEKQLAALDTIGTELEQDIADKKIEKLIESQKYNDLPVTLQIKIAQRIGKNDSVSMTNEIQTEYNNNPTLQNNAAALEMFLNKYEVNIDSENGVDIHRQAAQRNALEDFKKTLRGDQIVKESAYKKDLLKTTFNEDVMGILYDTQYQTSAEKWEAIFNLDQGITGLDNLDKNPIVFEAVKEYAETNNDINILDESIIHPNFSNKLYAIVRDQTQQTIINKVNSQKIQQNTIDNINKQRETDRQVDAGWETLVDFYNGEGENLDLNSITDRDARNTLKAIMDNGVGDTLTSELNAKKLDEKVQDMIYKGGTFIDSRGQQAQVTPLNVREYIANAKEINAPEKLAIARKVKGYFEMGNIFDGKIANQVFNPAMVRIEKAIFDKLDDGIDGADVTRADIKGQMEDFYILAYRDAYKDGYFGLDDFTKVREQMSKEAERLIKEYSGEDGEGDDVSDLTDEIMK